MEILLIFLVGWFIYNCVDITRQSGEDEITYIYKKCVVHNKYGRRIGSCIVSLKVPRDARIVRFHNGEKKIRVSKAKVKHIGELIPDEEVKWAITSEFETSKEYIIPHKVSSIYDPNFEYKLGETVEPKAPFNPDPYIPCGSGIHGFMTKGEALEY